MPSSSSIFAAGTTGRKDVCKADFTFLLTYTGTSPLISVSAMLSFFVGKVSLVLPTFLDHTQKVTYGIIMTFFSH